MRTLKEDFFDNLGIGEEKQIRDWLESHKIRNYTLNNDLSIDVRGKVEIYEDLPEYIQFNNIYGSFIVLFENVTSMKGFPKYVEKSFFISKTNIEILDNCPEEVNDFEIILNKKLKKIESLPKKINGIARFYQNGKRTTSEIYRKLCSVTKDKVYDTEKSYKSYMYICYKSDN